MENRSEMTKQDTKITISVIFMNQKDPKQIEVKLSDPIKKMKEHFTGGRLQQTISFSNYLIYYDGERIRDEQKSFSEFNIEDQSRFQIYLSNERSFLSRPDYRI